MLNGWAEFVLFLWSVSIQSEFMVCILLRTVFFCRVEHMEAFLPEQWTYHGDANHFDHNEKLINSFLCAHVRYFCLVEMKKPITLDRTACCLVEFDARARANTHKKTHRAYEYNETVFCCYFFVVACDYNDDRKKALTARETGIHGPWIIRESALARTTHNFQLTFLSIIHCTFIIMIVCSHNIVNVIRSVSDLRVSVYLWPCAVTAPPQTQFNACIHFHRILIHLKSTRW